MKDPGDRGLNVGLVAILESRGLWRTVAYSPRGVLWGSPAAVRRRARGCVEVRMEGRAGRRHEGIRSGRNAGGTGSLTVVGSRDDEAWANALAGARQHDFHHLAAYHRVAESRGEGTAALFVHRAREFTIALPLLLRPVDAADPAGHQDATSVYGYAGPVASHQRIPSDVLRAFHAELQEELVSRRVVAVFSRLHPLIEQRGLLAGLGEIRRLGRTVSVDLTLPLEDQWAAYSKTCRRTVRKAQVEGVVCVHDREMERRSEWVGMYQETMHRVGAAASYFFDEAYFDLLAAELGEVLHLFVALYEEEAIAAGLYTICDGIVQAHLGATRSAYAKLSPTRLLDDTVRRWAHEAGARVFHLGGGVGGHEDSLFEYKASFSSRRHRFETWRWVVNAPAYRELCARSGRADAMAVGNDEYFPGYRLPAPDLT